jgi:3-oxoacyl-[acyl-carrier protein] reductase
MSLINLSGRSALVTGGSRGVGAATAIMLAEAGASVAITYKTRKADADNVLGQIRGILEGQGGDGPPARRPASPPGVGSGAGDGPPARPVLRRTPQASVSKGPTALPPVAIQADLSHRTDCDRAVQQTVDAFGGLDIFVANAGIWPYEDVSVEDMDDDRWRETLAVNLDSVFFGCRAALRAMRVGGEGPRSASPPVRRSARGVGGEGKQPAGPPARQPARGVGGEGKQPAYPPTRLPAGGGGAGGRIVIVSSTAGQRGEAYHADYAATKGAIISFVKSLAVEAAPEVTVNACAPGWIDTEMSQVVYEREGGGGKGGIEKTIPMGRVATAREVAGPIVFLCSELAAQVTGETLNVNGGSVMCG